MEKIDLTSEADLLLCLMYKSYMERRNDGENRDDAAMFGSALQVKQRFKLGWSEEDVASVMFELHAEKLVGAFGADNTVIESSLLNRGVCYMDEQFSRKADAVLNRIIQIKQILF